MYIGCVVGSLIINHLLYADDLVLISPSSRGLHTLLGECEAYGIEHNIKFNANKSAILCFKTNSVGKFKVPDFFLRRSSGKIKQIR